MLSANSGSFSFLIYMIVFTFACFIALARTSSTMFNESDESGYPSLAPDLREKVYSLLPVNILLAVEEVPHFLNIKNISLCFSEFWVWISV